MTSIWKEDPLTQTRTVDTLYIHVLKEFHHGTFYYPMGKDTRNKRIKGTSFYV